MKEWGITRVPATNFVCVTEQISPSLPRPFAAVDLLTILEYPNRQGDMYND